MHRTPFYVGYLCPLAFSSKTQRKARDNKLIAQCLYQDKQDIFTFQQIKVSHLGVSGLQIRVYK